MTPEPAPHAEPLRLLEEAGAAVVPHPSGSFLAHLRGTRDCLARWGCPTYLCDAGLYHSVYGTEAFGTATVPSSERARVREQIGAEAEELVHLYCRIVRRSLYENLSREPPHHVVDRATGSRTALRDRRQLADLLTLDLANRLEQLPRTSRSLWRLELDRRRYEKAAPLLPSAAVAELRATYRPRSRTAIAADGVVRGVRRLGRWLGG